MSKMAETSVSPPPPSTVSRPVSEALLNEKVRTILALRPYTKTHSLVTMAQNERAKKRRALMTDTKRSGTDASPTS